MGIIVEIIELIPENIECEDIRCDDEWFGREKGEVAKWNAWLPTAV